MPTREQMREVVERIEREGTEAFTAIAWNGFSEAQVRDIQQRALAGESPDFWMDGVKLDCSYHQVIDAYAGAHPVRERHRGLTR
jgi:hypothetical protein